MAAPVARGQRSSRRAAPGGMPAAALGRRGGLRAALARARRGRRGRRAGDSAPLTAARASDDGPCRSPRPARPPTTPSRRPFTRPRRRDGRPRGGAGASRRRNGASTLPAGRGRRRARRHVRWHREASKPSTRRWAGVAQAPSVVEPLRESILPLRCMCPQPALAEGERERGCRVGKICKRVWPVSQRDGADDGGGESTAALMPVTWTAHAERAASTRTASCWRCAGRASKEPGGAPLERDARDRASRPAAPSRWRRESVAADGHGAQGDGACCCGFVSDSSAPRYSPSFATRFLRYSSSSRLV